MTEKEKYDNINKFYVAMHIACEYFDMIEGDLNEMFETDISTTYKHRFSANKKDRRKFEKLIKEDKAKFKSNTKAFKTKSKKMLSHFDKFKNPETEKLIDSVYDHLDEIVK